MSRTERDRMTECSVSSSAMGDEVMRLTWAVLDGEATDDDRRRLGELVTSEYQARREYVRAVRLDSELSDLLNPHAAQRSHGMNSGRVAELRGASLRALPPAQTSPPIQSCAMTG